MTTAPAIPVRTPPHDLAAESCVLGSMIVEAKQVDAVREILSADDFYRPANANIFKVLCWMHDNPDRFGQLDLVTLRAALLQRGSMCKVTEKATEQDGFEYLVGLVEGCPASCNAVYYARIVKDKSDLRTAILTAQEVESAAYADTEDAKAIVARAADTLTQASGQDSVRSSTPAADVGAVIESAIAGRRVAVPWPWQAVSYWARPTEPGTVAVLCGDPGTVKSLMLQQAFLEWHRAGVKVAMLHLEKDRKWHEVRALAQLFKCSDLTNTDWVHDNPDMAREAFECHKATLDSFGHCVWDDPSGNKTLDDCLAWVNARAGEGCRVIGLDPVSAVAQSDRHFAAEMAFVKKCEATAARHGCSIVCVTHPRDNKAATKSMDDLAGGRAWSRFTDVVMWLFAHEPPKQSTIKTKFGPTELPHNRTLTLFKTRGAAGKGISIALNFDPATLLLEEVGRIEPKPKKQKEEVE